jgi:hypothetical protein
VIWAWLLAWLLFSGWPIIFFDASPAADATIAIKSDCRNELDLVDANEQDHD